jgi:hypothetical protein
VSIGSVATPVDVKRPLVARNKMGSSFDAKCFTIQEPAVVAENALTIREYKIQLARV